MVEVGDYIGGFSQVGNYLGIAVTVITVAAVWGAIIFIFMLRRQYRYSVEVIEERSNGVRKITRLKARKISKGGKTKYQLSRFPDFWNGEYFSHPTDPRQIYLTNKGGDHFKLIKIGLNEYQHVGFNNELNEYTSIPEDMRMLRDQLIHDKKQAYSEKKWWVEYAPYIATAMMILVVCVGFLLMNESMLATAQAFGQYAAQCSPNSPPPTPLAPP